MPLLREIPQPLLEDIIEDRCLPIIGAGFSRNAVFPQGARMPLWRDLGRAFGEYLGLDATVHPLESISEYEHAFSRPKLIETLRKLLLVDESEPGKAHRAFCRLPFTIVATTNMDFLLEKGYWHWHRPCRILLGEDQLSVGTDRESVSLLKLHGDLSHPKHLIVTERDYERFLSDYPLLGTYLSSLLVTRTPLLIGYSMDDPDFRAIWHVIGQRLGFLRRKAYALGIAATESERGKFERRGVCLITFKSAGRDSGSLFAELFDELWDYWAERVPTKSVVTREMAAPELSLPRGVQTSLCYFSVPPRAMEFYASHVFRKRQTLHTWFGAGA